MSPVRGTADLDREHFVWGRWTWRQLVSAAPFAMAGFVCLIIASGLAAKTGQTAGAPLVGAGVGFAVTYVILQTPFSKGFVARFRRQHLGPHTYVNGPITTLPKEFQTRSYRRAQKRIAVLSAPFEGFDESGRFLVKGGCCRVLKVSPIDMDLRSEREKAQLEKRFARLLFTTDEATTVHVAGEPITFEAEIDRLRAVDLGAKVNDEAQDYAAFLETLSGYRRQVYVACWGTDAETADMRAQTVAEQLARMGLDTHRPTPSEMAALTALLSGGQVPYRNYPSDPTVRPA